MNFDILINLLDPLTRAGRMCNYGTVGPKLNFNFFFKLYKCSFRCTYRFLKQIIFVKMVRFRRKVSKSRD